MAISNGTAEHEYVTDDYNEEYLLCSNTDFNDYSTFAEAVNNLSTGTTEEFTLYCPKLYQKLYAPVEGNKTLPIHSFEIYVTAAGDPSDYKITIINYYWVSSSNTCAIYFYLKKGSAYFTGIGVQVKYYPFMQARFKLNNNGIIPFTNPALNYFKQKGFQDIFYAYPDCACYEDANFYYEGNPLCTTRKEGIEDWKETFNFNRYSTETYPEGLHPIKPGYNPRFARCLLELESLDYSRDDTRYLKSVYISRPNNNTLQLTIREGNVNNSNYYTYQTYTFDINSFPDRVIPSRLLLLVQAAGAGGSGGGRDPSGPDGAGGGSGSLCCFVINTDSSNVLSSDKKRWWIKLGDRGNGGNSFNPGARGNDGTDSEVIFQRIDTSFTPHNLTLITIPAGKSKTGAGEPTYLNNGKGNADTGTEDITLVWNMCSVAGKDGAAGCGNTSSADSTSRLSIHCTGSSTYAKGTNKLILPAHTGGSTAVIDSGNSGGGGGASYFADGVSGSTSDVVIQGSRGAGGGGATAYHTGGAGGSSYLQIWY